MDDCHDHEVRLKYSYKIKKKKKKFLGDRVLREVMINFYTYCEKNICHRHVKMPDDDRK